MQTNNFLRNYREDYLYSIFLFVSFVQTAFAAAEAEGAAKKRPEYFIFIGNPGVGKSTLINSLIGRRVAEAGVNAGCGLTKKSSMYKHEDNYFMDTPGLADISLRDQAAKEIERALKRDGVYHIFFALKLSAGRIIPEDVVTINAVMDSLPDAGDNFNIIVNQVSKKEKAAALTSPEFLAKIYSDINSGAHKTESIYCIDMDRRMEDSESEFIEISPNLADFIFNSSRSIRITSKKVRPIKTKEYEAMREEYQKNMAMLSEQIRTGHENTKALVAQMAELQKKLAEQTELAKEAVTERKSERSKTHTSSTIVICSVM